jgi:TRAP transporter 4TM/12TM fusion protein
LATDIEKASAALQELVADSDTGGRKIAGPMAKAIFAIALFWSLFQLWQASPLPFVLGWGILNDTESRSVHLALGMLLAFLVWPAFKSARASIPWYDWLFAIAGAFAAGYFMLFYAELATRPGQPSTMDIATAIVGMVLLLEATRRSVGWPMALLAIVFILYSLFGPYLPEVLQHKGASVNRLLSHMWLTTEGVYGVALGVSAGTIFVYVLFGAMLDRAGAGNYMMQVSYAALGHLRGGPAKVAVISSGMNGLISGSSVSNVVSGGIFTIPLMKKAGYGGVKAGAIETMASVDGQIMPPVMGAAAFLMVEYVGIPYTEVCKHAFLPAILSYIGLFYIVHLEALKLGMRPIIRRDHPPLSTRALRWGMGISGSLAVVCILYFVLEAAKRLMGDMAGWAIGAVVTGLYVYATKQAAAEPDLPQDIDVDNPKPLDTWPTVKAGLHFLLPIGTLVWALMIEELSPALSAFWAVAILIVLMATQHVLIAWFRGRRTEIPLLFKQGCDDVAHGLNDGARNMIGVAIATGTAGIIVGGITLTGLGLRMTDFVEFVAQGDVIVMLLFVAFVCLVLGLGVPTTANYVLVATLMAPVVVELGAQNGLVIPLIAVHLFVFYYGIMGDITPPVGLATFAAAAISGESAIATGVQGATYALRTVILPFLWIFNPQLLLIGVHSWLEVLLVASASLVAMMAFAAITMNWFRIRCKWWEILMLLAGITFLFRPDFFMDRVAPEYRNEAPARIFEVASRLPENERLVVVIEGLTLEGEQLTKTVAVDLGAAGDGAKRIGATGVQLMQMGDTVRVAAAKFGSVARKAGFQEGFTIQTVKVPSDRPSVYWFYLPGLLLIGLVYWLQGRRMKPAAAAGVPA